MLNIFGLCITLIASIAKKKKRHCPYCYLVESARVDGQPHIAHQAYLDTAEKSAELIQQETEPTVNSR